MMLVPVAGDVDSPGEPDILVFHEVVQHTFDSGCARRMTYEARVHADRHHARTLSALLVQHVKGVADELIPQRCRSGLCNKLSIIVG